MFSKLQKERKKKVKVSRNHFTFFRIDEGKKKAELPQYAKTDTLSIQISFQFSPGMAHCLNLESAGLRSMAAHH